MNPLDEVLAAKETLEKQGQGFFGQMWQGAKSAIRPESLGGELTRGAVGAFAGGAAIAAIPAARKIIDSIRKRRDFREMMETHPQLHDMHQDNPRFFNAAYSSMRRMNPLYARDPLVAGSLMDKMMQNPAQSGLLLAETMRQVPNESMSALGPLVAGSFAKRWPEELAGRGRRGFDDR